MDVKNKVAIVTGGSKGIGLATAQKLLDKGARIAVYSKNVSDAKKELNSDNVLLIEGDVVNRVEVKKAVELINQKFGTWDILVNNAGIAFKKSFLDTTDQDWDLTFDVNIKGIFIMTQEAMKGISFNKERVVINISSGAGFYGIADLAAYCATKAAVINLTQSLEEELGNKNIRFITITPGSTHTEMFSSLFPDRKAYHKPEEVAEVIYKSITREIQPDNRLVVDVFEHVR